MIGWAQNKKGNRSRLWAASQELKALQMVMVLGKADVLGKQRSNAWLGTCRVQFSLLQPK